MAAPKITAWVNRVNDPDDTTELDLTGDENTLIRYYSTAHAGMAVETQGGALNEDMYIIINGSKTVYGSSGDFRGVESDTFTFSAEDEYGNIGTATVTAEKMVYYVIPTCDIANSTIDGAGNMTLSCSGRWFNDTFGKKYNSLSAKYHYYDSEDNYFSGDMTVRIESNNRYYAFANLSGLDYRETYSFYVTVIDELSTVTEEKEAVTSSPIFHWGKNDFTFEVPVKFNANTGETNFKGDLRLKGDSNFGNTLYFGNGEYCYIREATDDIMTIKASRLNINTSTLNESGIELLLNGHSVDFRTWTPTLNVQGPGFSYAERYGWCQKLGKVVTIGWKLKANVPPGRNGSELWISGVPFAPLPFAFDEYGEVDYDAGLAFGGGVAFNIYTTGSFIFEGWSINANGVIKARLQECDKTASGDLQIGSTCYYPEGGGTVTLAGTICYMV